MSEVILPTGIVTYTKLLDGVSRVFIDYDEDTLFKRSSLLSCHSLVTNKSIEEWESQKGLVKVRKLNIIKRLLVY